MLQSLALRPNLRHIPVAEYTLGLCYYGHTEPFKTVAVKADSRQAAMIEGRNLLNPSTVQSVRYISVAANAEHIAYQAELRRGYAAFDAAVASNALRI